MFSAGTMLNTGMETSLRELVQSHHQLAENNELSRKMASGTICPKWWADWVAALLTIHQSFDHCVPAPLTRVHELAWDVCHSELPIPTLAAAELAQKIQQDPLLQQAAGYVFTGAHLMGGAIIKKNLSTDLSSRHLEWEDRATAIELWRPWRTKVELAPQAIYCFEQIALVCEQIQQNRQA